VKPAETQSATSGQPLVGSVIRARRRQMHMTLQELCDAAGISVGYLSQVERDQATPSLGTLAHIARALKVGVDYFIATPDIESSLTRAGEREVFTVRGAPLTYERLCTDFAGNVLSSFIITIPPGYLSETTSHEGEEIMYVLAGNLTVLVDGHDTVLSPGDSFHLRGNNPHAWSNRGGKDVRLLWTGTVPLYRKQSVGQTTAKPGRLVSVRSLKQSMKTRKKEENEQ
jgi:transcriptional regulator with XRE-family HTH domain